ncbi:MAG TPA: acyl-ACP--UDP-N-acetylglucosamine O-acyltransferase [Opitutales bacterium]|jgi:UDP-N-acetylglucosamine acyltransferase|nr:acyl-ACP--UDP-N-acetylglucosamine O-acyltransferase [Opitutales bacterium]
MPTQIHPTAIIEKGAALDEGVVVGAYAYVGAEVKLGAGTVLHHHACVEGFTQLGAENEVFPFALIGSKTHDLKFTGGKPGLRAGVRNVFREYATVHAGTKDGEFTVLGDDNVVLAYSHIAHDCVVGNHLVMSSHAALGGHVVVGDHVNVGWNVGIHQFCRLGAHSMAGACAKVVQDVPPFMIADGNPAGVRTINKVGLERSGFSAEDIALARTIYKILYREGLNRTQAVEKLRAHPQATHALIGSVLTFISQSERGLAAGGE